MAANNYDLYGGGAMGAYFDLQSRDMERQVHDSRLKSEALNQEQQSLANMFSQQNDPIRLDTSRQQLSNSKLKGEQDQMDFDYQKQMQPYKVTAELADYAKKATQADIDGLYLNAQKMAYSPDKATSAEGLRQMQLHKDFVMLRQKGEQAQELVNTRATNAVNLEGVKQGNRVQLKNIPSAGGGGGGAKAPSALSTDKYTAALMQQLSQAQRQGNQAGVDQVMGQLNLLAQYKAAARPDTGAGKPAIQADGSIAPTPPRPPLQAPTVTGVSKPSLPSGWTMK
jgi:hypothetical protein